MVCFNLLYALCLSTEATTKNTGNSQVISKSKKTVSSQTTHPSWTHLVNPTSAVQGFCFCPEKLIFDTMDFVQKNTPKSPRFNIQCVKLWIKWKNIHIHTYTSQQGGEIVHDWLLKFCEEIYQCFCRSTSEKGTEMTVMSLERKNSTQQL